MRHSLGFLVTAILMGIHPPAWSQEKTPKKVADGVYLVLRDSLDEKEVLPLKEGEIQVVNRHRYAKADAKEAPRYLVVRAAPDVELSLAEDPKTDKDGDEVVRILLKLQPNSATALEKVTGDGVGKQLAIVIGGEVATSHKIREAIKGGELQITSCTPGAAKFLLGEIQTLQKKK